MHLLTMAGWVAGAAVFLALGACQTQEDGDSLELTLTIDPVSHRPKPTHRHALLAHRAGTGFSPASRRRPRHSLG